MRKSLIMIEWIRGWKKPNINLYFSLIKPKCSHSEMPGKWLMKPESLEKGTKHLNSCSMFGILAEKCLFHQNFCHRSPCFLRNMGHLKPHESRFEFHWRTLSIREQMKQQWIISILCERAGSIGQQHRFLLCCNNHKSISWHYLMKNCNSALQKWLFWSTTNHHTQSKWDLYSLVVTLSLIRRRQEVLKVLQGIRPPL